VNRSLLNSGLGSLVDCRVKEKKGGRTLGDFSRRGEKISPESRSEQSELLDYYTKTQQTKNQHNTITANNTETEKIKITEKEKAEIRKLIGVSGDLTEEEYKWWRILVEVRKCMLGSV